MICQACANGDHSNHVTILGDICIGCHCKERP